jgi:hypothetical protein
MNFANKFYVFWSAVYINLASGKRSTVGKLSLLYLCQTMKRELLIVVNSLYKVYSNAEQFCTLTDIYRTKGESSTLC